jgi:coenzyme F420-0:L-glutamate ligase/coenzyme F420-1:gamma-L-glutamate ligase
MAFSIDRRGLDAIARVIATRRSIRRYAAQSIPEEIIDELLRCAADAPSAHNRQPWRFAVLRGLETKARLAKAMGDRLRNDRIRDGDPPARIDADVERSYERITGAPVVVLVATTCVEMDAYTDPARSRAENLMAIQSTAMAVQNLLLAAHAAGLAGCWMCGPLFCQDVARSVLNLESDWQPQAIVTLGFPGSPGKPYARRPLGDVVRNVDEA